MKQKRSRDLFEKRENGSVGNTLAQGENTVSPRGERREAGRGVPPVRFKTPTKLAGARRLRWSPALNHGEAERSEGTKRFRVFFRVGGWWTWPSESTTSTATLSPADGGSGDGGVLRWVLQTPN